MSEDLKDLFSWTLEGFLFLIQVRFTSLMRSDTFHALTV